MALYCFGDSYTEGYKNDMQFWPYDAYRKYLGLEDPMDMPPIWSEILGEKLDTDSFNYAKGGASNHETLLRFCEHSSKFKKGDIVIINWTYIQRCTWVIDPEGIEDYGYHITSVSPYQGEHYDPDNLYKDAYDIIAINRLKFSWTYEVLRYQTMIDTMAKEIGFDVYYWFTDDYLQENLAKIENLNQRKYILHDLMSEYNEETYGRDNCNIMFNTLRLYGAKTIQDDSNGAGHDPHHLGGTGHRVQAEMFYSYITNKPYLKKLEEYL